MQDIILSLVFASALLFFMIHPATVLTEWTARYLPLSLSARNTVAVVMTIVLALLAGAALRWL